MSAEMLLRALIGTRCCGVQVGLGMVMAVSAGQFSLFNWPNIFPHTLHLPPVACFMAHFLQSVAWPQGTHA